MLLVTLHWRIVSSVHSNLDSLVHPTGRQATPMVGSLSAPQQTLHPARLGFEVILLSPFASDLSPSPFSPVWSSKIPTH